MTTIKVSVTQDHIDRGKKHNACECAFALAVRAALPVHLLGATVYVGDNGEFDEYWTADIGTGAAWPSAPLPYAVIYWIRLFDDGAKVEPFEVELTWPELVR